MSTWIEKIQSGLVITMGDGTQFQPMWMNAEKETEFNIALFDFPDVDGTFVNRSMPKGSQYKLEIYFEGADNLDVREAFEEAAKDKRPWLISHPLYGSLTVQPIRIAYDNTKNNVTKITIPIMETIENVNPSTEIVPVDTIMNGKENADASVSAVFPVLRSVPVVALKSTNQSIYDIGAADVNDSSVSQDYFNAFSDANSAITDFTQDPLMAIQKIQAFINAPFLFTQSVQSRLSTLERQLNLLISKISNASSNTDKLFFELYAGAVVSSMSVVAATPLSGNYNNKASVLSVNLTILNNYNSYVTTINNLAGVNGGSPYYWVPNAALQLLLNQLLNFTISNLIIIALGARQEREIFLEENSNIILLAHRFYGLTVDDETIEYFKLSNAIGLNEILEIKKGRKILYYV